VGRISSFAFGPFPFPLSLALGPLRAKQRKQRKRKRKKSGRPTSFSWPPGAPGGRESGAGGRWSAAHLVFSSRSLTLSLPTTAVVGQENVGRGWPVSLLLGGPAQLCEQWGGASEREKTKGGRPCPLSPIVRPRRGHDVEKTGPTGTFPLEAMVGRQACDSKMKKKGKGIAPRLPNIASLLPPNTGRPSPTHKAARLALCGCWEGEERKGKVPAHIPPLFLALAFPLPGEKNGKIAEGSGRHGGLGHFVLCSRHSASEPSASRTRQKTKYAPHGKGPAGRFFFLSFSFCLPSFPPFAWLASRRPLREQRGKEVQKEKKRKKKEMWPA